MNYSIDDGLGSVCSMFRGVRRIGRSILALMLVAGLSTSAYAQSASGAYSSVGNRFHLSLGVSQNVHSTTNNELSEALQSFEGTLTDYDNSHVGGHIGINYVLANGLMFSAGGRALGQLDNSWTIDTPEETRAIEEIQALMPTIGDGLYAGIGYRRFVFNRFYAQISLEALQWQQEFTTSQSGRADLIESREGVSPIIMIGVGAQLSETVNLSVDTRRFDFDGEVVTGVEISLEWTPRRAVKNTNTRVTVNKRTENRRADSDTTDATAAPVTKDKAEEAKTTRRVIYFALGSEELTQESLEIIDEVVENYQPGMIISLTGWADATIAAGTSPEEGNARNLVKADDRAIAVLVALIDRGIPANAIVGTAKVSTEVGKNARRVDLEY